MEPDAMKRASRNATTQRRAMSMCRRPTETRIRLRLPATSSKAPATRTCQVSPLHPVPKGRNASEYPRELVRCRELAEGWLKSAVQSGHTEAWEPGYPRYVWYRHGRILYEARQGSPGSGECHGYPLDRSLRARGL